MRFGIWRGVTLALGMAVSLIASTDSLAGGFHLIKGEVDAINYDTGAPYYAPPIPYGHYAKDPIGHVGKKVGGLTHSIFGKFHSLGSGAKCGSCGGAGCGACGGSGLFNHGHGGDGCGSGGCGLGGMFSHADKGCGVCGIGHSSTAVIASGQEIVAPQAPIVSPQGGVIAGDPCSACGKPGCGLFGKPGCGLLGKHGGYGGCGSCGGAGCGACGGGAGFGSGCKACGGRGCGLCSKAKGLASGLVGKLLHRDKIKWFVGPGGPVPLTPGYVPYVISTRSPRDFLAFPPFNPDVP